VAASAADALAATASSHTAPALRGGASPRKREKPWRRYFRTTREGKAFIFVTAGVGLAAINTGNNLLFLIFGFMLSLIVLSGILSEIVLRNLWVSRRLPQRAFAESTCLVEITLRNKKQRAPSYSLEVEDLAHGLPTERRCYFLKVAPQAEQIAGYRRTIKRRGYVRLRGFRVATRYPFGIIEKWRVIEAEEELLVYPALMREDLQELSARGTGAEAITTRIGVGNEVAGLRHYRPGDGARSIHWMRTAALGRVMVYEKHADASTHLTIVLDNARPQSADARWDAGFERAISRAAAIAVSNLGREMSAEVVCRGQRSPVVIAGSPVDPILRFLALLESVPAASAPPIGALQKAAQVVEVPVVLSAVQVSTAPPPRSGA
jgi:uncharacterized protein (DUF58 family)